MNNFNLLRLGFALMVAVYHVMRLSGVWPESMAILAVGAEIGVQGFFIVSGYLVFASYERSSSLLLYAEKRFRRLYPAYVVVILACTFGALAFSPAARADLAEVGRYFGLNMVFLNFLKPDLPGVFVGNPIAEINGALWTLKIEVLFYIVLPALAFFLRLGGERMRWWIIGGIYVGAEIWRMSFEQFEPAPIAGLAHQLPGQMSFFISGVALYIIRDRIDWRVAPPLGLILFAASMASPYAEPLRAAGLGIITVWTAIAIPRLFDAARYGDISYGLYIVHFPIIQVIVANNGFANPWVGTALTVVLCVGVSLAMWWFIERPALRADSAYRTDAKVAAA